MNALRPSGDATQQWLIDAFAKMESQWSLVMVALHAQAWIVWSLTVLIEQKMLRNGAKAGHLEDACVQDEFQWQGIGKTLLGMAVDHATQAWCYKIIGDTRDELVPWFTKHGFDSPERMVRRYL